MFIPMVDKSDNAVFGFDARLFGSSLNTSLLQSSSSSHHIVLLAPIHVPSHHSIFNRVLYSFRAVPGLWQNNPRVKAPKPGRESVQQLYKYHCDRSNTDRVHSRVVIANDNVIIQVCSSTHLTYSRRSVPSLRDVHLKEVRQP